MTMKRLFAISALIIMLAGCSKPSDSGLELSVNETIKTSISVSVEETRATAGKNSAEGVFVNGVLGTATDNVTMRYILHVYMNGVRYLKFVKYSDGTEVEFTPDLIPNREYTFVVWADVVTEGNKDVDNHYDTSNIEAITLKGDWRAMDESRDAFTGVVTKENFTGESVNISLVRPFAKLRIMTTDKNQTQSVPAKGVVEYTTPHRTTFNAKTGEVVANKYENSTRTHTYAIDTYTEDTDTSLTLFTDYFFAAESDEIALTFKFYEAGKEDYPIINKTYTASNVAVKPNHITTITGKLLTGDNSIDIGQSDITVTEWGDGGETVITGIVDDNLGGNNGSSNN